MAVSAHGTVIKRNGVTVNEVRDITPPSLSRETVDVTRKGDVDERLKVGIRNFGELAFEANLVFGDTTVAGLITAWKNGTLDTYEVDWTDGGVWNFSGYVRSVQPQAPVDGLLSVRFIIRPADAVSFDEAMLLEDGDALLLETGGGISIEA